MLLQQYMSSKTGSVRPSQTHPLNLAKPNKNGFSIKVEEVLPEGRTEQGNSLFVNFLMVPSLLREIVELRSDLI